MGNEVNFSKNPVFYLILLDYELLSKIHQNFNVDKILEHCLGAGNLPRFYKLLNLCFPSEIGLKGIFDFCSYGIVILREMRKNIKN